VDIPGFDEDFLKELPGFEPEPPPEPGEPPDISKAEELRKAWGTELGQLWALGEHRLAVGDCTDRGVVEGVMGGESADMVATDPPYNVSIFGGTHDPRDKKNYGAGPKIQNDNMSDEEFDKFLLNAFMSIDKILKAGGVYYICAPAGRTETQFRIALEEVFGLRECIVWVKQQFVFGRQDYHWRHESILYGWKNGAAHYFCDDKTQDTVWEFDRPMRSEKEHPTQKPFELFFRMISNSSKFDELVYDPFLGSGTTLIACENLNRRCRGIEISPAYAAVCLQRFVDYAGIDPVLLSE
jgi:DNA modification methylase